MVCRLYTLLVIQPTTSPHIVATSALRPAFVSPDLMGGGVIEKKLINFIIDDSQMIVLNGNSYNMTALEDMTWEEFINSDYNTDNNNDYGVLYADNNHIRVGLGNAYIYSDVDSVFAQTSPTLISDKIIANHTYYIGTYYG